MATHFGRIQEFQPEFDTIKAYLEQVQLYFTANDIADGKQVPILHELNWSAHLLSPQQPNATSTKSLADISAALRRHFEPKRAIIVERFHFHKRDQPVGETIAEFDAALRKLTVHCNFDGYLEDALCDRFVCGLRHKAIQHRLLSEKVLLLHQSHGIADRNTKVFKGSEPFIKEFTSSSSKPRERQACYQCGRSNHDPNDCKFKDAECHTCRKKGHNAPA